MNPYDLIYDLLNILIFHIISSCSCFEHLLVFQAAQLNEFLEQLPEACNKVLLGCHMMSPWRGSKDLLHPFDHGPMAPWPRFAWTTRRVTRLGTGQRVVIRCSHLSLSDSFRHVLRLSGFVHVVISYTSRVLRAARVSSAKCQGQERSISATRALRPSQNHLPKVVTKRHSLRKRLMG